MADEATTTAASAVPERFRSTSAPMFRQEYMNEWTGPRQCEVVNLAGTARCTNAAEYALTAGDRTGYVCGECVGQHVRANAKHRPVTVERLRP